MQRKIRFIVLTIVFAIMTGVYISDYLNKYQSESAHISQQEFSFKNKDSLDSHFKKHGIEMGFKNANEYLKRANEVIKGKNIHTKQEDNDIAYFNTETGEFVVLSPQGIIRTFFIPDDGIKYFKAQ